MAAIMKVSRNISLQQGLKSSSPDTFRYFKRSQRLAAARNVRCRRRRCRRRCRHRCRRRCRRR